jgi:hypothetical protein
LTGWRRYVEISKFPSYELEDTDDDDDGDDDDNVIDFDDMHKYWDQPYYLLNALAPGSTDKNCAEYEGMVFL